MTERRSFSHFLGISYFVHPVPLSAVVLLFWNDRWLKVHHPSVLSGKLSDFAGLFFFPLFLCALVSLMRNLIRPREFLWIGPRLLLSAIGITDLVFAAIKLYRPATDLYVYVSQRLGFVDSRVTMDPTDLVALLSSVAVYYFARRFWASRGDLELHNHDRTRELSVV